jgi:chemotaxis protein MotB
VRIWREREEDLENLLNKGSQWAISYGDLMSNLMVFFLMMFVFAVAKNENFEEGLGTLQTEFGGQLSEEQKKHMAIKAQERDVAQDLKEKFSSEELKKHVDVVITPDRIQITLREHLMFDSGKRELKENAVGILHEIAIRLKDLPNPIQIEGHTDDVPVSEESRYGSNWQLSMARAFSVIESFLEAGVDPKRLSGTGYSEFQPVVPNANEDNRARNRRIEIAVIRHRMGKRYNKYYAPNGNGKG